MVNMGRTERNKPEWISVAVTLLGVCLAHCAFAASTTEYLYDDVGDVTATWVHDAAGTTLAYTSSDYDALGRQSEVISYAGDSSRNVTNEYQYDVSGNLSIQSVKTTGDDFKTTYWYDILGRQITVQGPSTSAGTNEMPETLYEYDNNGNVITERVLLDDSGTAVYAVTGMAYDELGRVTKRTDPGDHYRETYYDSLGRVVRELAKNSDNNNLAQSRTVYDATGRAISRIRMLYADTASTSSADVTIDNVTVYDYDVDGRVATQSSFNMGSSTPLLTSSEYDGLGRLTKTTDPAGNISERQYDGSGLVTKSIEASTEGRSITAQMSYGDGNRLIQSVVLGDGSTADLTTQYAYDCVGRRTSVTDPKGYETKYEYDLLGRQTKVIEEDPEGGSNNRETEYIFSKQGLLATQIAHDSPNNQTTIYEYAPNGKIATIRYPDANPSSEYDKIDFTYYANGAISTRTEQGVDSGSRSVLEYYYDLRGLLTLKCSPDVGGVRAYWAGYEYDGLGRMTQSEMRPSGTLTSSTTYVYDDLSRVVSEYQWVHGMANAKTLYMGYDQAGNRMRLAYPELSD